MGHCVRYISRPSTLKAGVASSKSELRPESMVRGRCHRPFSSFSLTKMSAFFVPVMPLSSSPCASLRVEEKKSWSNSSPKSIG